MRRMVFNDHPVHALVRRLASYARSDPQGSHLQYWTMLRNVIEAIPLPETRARGSKRGS